MSFCVTIQFNGNCREAVTYYAKVFGQPVPSILTYEHGEALLSSEFQIPAKMKSCVMQSRLYIEGTPVEFCDTPDTFGFCKGENMFLNVTYKKYDKANRVFDLLSQDGEVDVPFVQMKDGMYFGMLKDRFHVRWNIICTS